MRYFCAAFFYANLHIGIQKWLLVFWISPRLDSKYLLLIQSGWPPLEDELIALCRDHSPVGLWKKKLQMEISHIWGRSWGLKAPPFETLQPFRLRLWCKGCNSVQVRVKSCYSGDRGAVIKKPDLIPNQGAQGPHSLFTVKGLATHTPSVTLTGFYTPINTPS